MRLRSAIDRISRSVVVFRQGGETRSFVKAAARLVLLLNLKVKLRCTVRVRPTRERGEDDPSDTSSAEIRPRGHVECAVADVHL